MSGDSQSGDRSHRREFRARDVRILRPYPDEVPWDLLLDGGADEEVLRSVQEQNFLRVAKHEGGVIGAYAIRPATATRFELVALCVAVAWRRKGLGRWLLGHAIGVAESRGAREIVCTGRGGAGERLLVRMGFEPAQTGLHLALTPE